MPGAWDFKAFQEKIYALLPGWRSILSGISACDRFFGMAQKQVKSRLIDVEDASIVLSYPQDIRLFFGSE